MVITLKERARGCFAGLAVGDALGSPTEGKTPDEIFEKWGRITDFLTEDQGGSDDTEYALFSAKLLLNKKRELTQADAAEAWRREIIKADNAYKGAGFSEIMTIQNLLKGLQPPHTGQHLHSWSDGLAMRIAPYGIAFCGDPNSASYYAGIDGSVSHSGEGIYSGQAASAAIAMAMTGAEPDEIIQTAIDAVPKDSWTSSALIRAKKIGDEYGNVWDALRPLYDELACSYYHWTDVAPEAVGLAFGLFTAAKGNFSEAVLGAVNIGRDTDTIAAITGAVCGALNGIDQIPEKWIKRISVSRGICINAVKGMNIIDTADELYLLAESWGNK
ncbi:MAG: ADP-ribosylglycohydrolase family protein [Bacillota bacterium]